MMTCHHSNALDRNKEKASVEYRSLLSEGDCVFKDLSLGKAAKDFIKPDQIMKYAKDIKFPTNKQGIVSAFKNGNSPQKITSALDNLPDKTYNSPQDLISGLTGMVDNR